MMRKVTALLAVQVLILSATMIGFAHAAPPSSRAFAGWGRQHAAGRSESALPPEAFRALDAARSRGTEPANATSVPDGAGGTYVAWNDFRDGTSDVYLQRVTNTGTVAAGWPADGLPVCTAAGTQSGVILWPDGSNGVIVGWGDSRADWKVPAGYAQRVNSTGTALWATNGVRVVSDVNEGAAGAPDGSGGIVAVWSMVGTTDMDIFAIRVDGTGAIPAAWGSGVLVCNATNAQINPSVAVDGAGFAVIAWEDNRAGAGDSHIYAQRLNGSGAAQWNPNGILLDASLLPTSIPAVCSGGAAGAYVFWSAFDNGGSVFGQRLDGAGTEQWAAGGVDISGGGTNAQATMAVTNVSGDAVVAWEGATFTGSFLRAQRVNSLGAAQWVPTAPFLVSASTYTPELEDVIATASGGAFFVWRDFRNPTTSQDLYAQRLDAAGAVQWGANGVAVTTAPREQGHSAAASDGSTGLIVAWVDSRSSFDEVFAQRLNAAGVAQLAADGIAVYTNPGVQVGSAVVPNDLGGAILVWNERRNGDWDIRARALKSDGTPEGPASLVCGAVGPQGLDGAISDGNGGAIVTWTDRRSGGEDIYAQRLNDMADPQWTTDGVAVCTAPGRQKGARVIPDDLGGAIFAWDDDRAGNTDVYAQRLNASGTPQWGTNGLAICDDPAMQFGAVLAPDLAGGAIIAWSDIRSFVTPAIFAQRVNAGGTVQWTANGVSIAEPGGFAFVSGAVSDQASGAIVLYNLPTQDPVTGMTIGSVLMAQRVNGVAAPQWGVTGSTVCDASGLVFTEQIASDLSSGAIVAWTDGRTPVTDIYAQRLNSLGLAQWGLNGKVVCDNAAWQTLGGITVDGSGFLELSWMDERNGYPDVYAQRLNTAGTAQWTANGRQVCGTARGQFGPSMGFKGPAPYDLFVTWTDNAAGDARFVYAQLLDATGARQWATDGVTSIGLSLVGAQADAKSVRLTWYAAAPVMATVYRCSTGSEWMRLGDVLSDGTGTITFEDTDVTPGTRYGYRLGLPESNGQTFRGEVWVDVPGRLEFALRGLQPNPAAGDLNVSFALAHSGIVKLEMLDLSGRRVWAREVPGLQAGAHTVRLDGNRPPPGVYFLRLTQSGRSVGARAVVR